MGSTPHMTLRGRERKVKRRLQFCRRCCLPELRPSQLPPPAPANDKHACLEIEGIFLPNVERSAANVSQKRRRLWGCAEVLWLTRTRGACALCMCHIAAGRITSSVAWVCDPWGLSSEYRFDSEPPANQTGRHCHLHQTCRQGGQEF